MPRKARENIIAPGLLYHIVCRGNNKRRIFRASRDYKKMLSILRETKKEYPFYLFAYSLMPNHYHFEIETIELPISKIMHQINNKYAKYFRHRHGGVGHLFQERYFAKAIDKDAYLWELARYIDLNAVRAKLVKKPEDYRWGSYSIYCQKEHKDNLIDRELFLSYGDEDSKKSRIFYLKFIEEGLREERESLFPIDKNMV